MNPHLGYKCSAVVIGQGQRIFSAVLIQRDREPFRVFAERCPVVRNDSPVAAGDDPASRISAELGEIAQQRKRRTVHAGFLFQLPERSFLDCLLAAAESAGEREHIFKRFFGAPDKQHRKHGF